MSSKSFTARQGQYLAFIDAYTRVHGRPPAETDMQRHFQLTPPSVHQMVLTLERLGHIRRQPGVARSIEVLLAPQDLPRSPSPPTSQILCAEGLAGCGILPDEALV
jgi:SOS-response transcriptional repressor LexA